MGAKVSIQAHATAGIYDSRLLALLLKRGFMRKISLEELHPIIMIHIKADSISES